MAAPEPTEAQQVEASRRVLVDVLQVLGANRDALVIVGGWVPELLFPGEGHVGSIDVDLALDLRRIAPVAYNTMKDRLLDSDYRLKAQGVTNVFVKDVPHSGQPVTVRIDLITGEQQGTVEQRPYEHIQGMNVTKLRGTELALAYCMEVQVTGELPNGGKLAQTAKVATVPAFICMKAIAMTERQTTKDAYDIHFCLRHYEGGPKALAKSFTELLGQTRVHEALTAMRGHFQSDTHIGPVWAGQEAAAHGDDEEIARQDAFQRAQAFFDALG